MTTIIPNRRWSLQVYVLLCLTICLSLTTRGQTPVDSLLGKVDPHKLATAIGKKASSIEEKLIAKSIKTLTRLQKQEEKLYRKMLKSNDSLAAKASLADIQARYTNMREKFKYPTNANASGQYISKLDSLTTTLKFLEQNGVGGKVKDALQRTTGLQDKFKQTEEIQKFIKARKQELKEQLEKLGMVKQLKKFNKEAYYYSAQIKEYKEILKDSKKIEKKALELLSKTKLFKDFFRKNSHLASLFRIPGDSGDLSSSSLEGLQTRAQVNNLIQQQIAAGGPSAAQHVSGNIQAAQAQLAQLKNNLLKSDGRSSVDDMPSFKPNNQKTKSFLKRLEYGMNVQTQKATSYFPITSDIGVSVGYKLNDKSVLSVGMSYKLGLGTGWRDLAITHQGIGLRSYVDIKLKGTFGVSGGYEQNYQSAFKNIEQLKDRNRWQHSGLIGLSKELTKNNKKIRMQLLWDFLGHNQNLGKSPLIFRVNYLFKTK